MDEDFFKTDEELKEEMIEEIKTTSVYKFKSIIALVRVLLFLFNKELKIWSIRLIFQFLIFLPIMFLFDNIFNYTLSFLLSNFLTWEFYGKKSAQDLLEDCMIMQRYIKIYDIIKSENKQNKN